MSKARLKIILHTFFFITNLVLNSPQACSQNDSLLYPSELIRPIAYKYFKSGANQLTLTRYGLDSTKPYVLLSLHSNERTGIEEGLNFIGENGGSLYELENKGQRYITANIKSHKIIFDPNRVFTMRGRSASIKSANYLKIKIQYLLSFSWFILSAIPEDKIIVAVHNNTDEGFSIHSYRKGGSMAEDASEVYLNTSMDPDDFFITTDPEIFEKLRNEDFSVVLQSKTAKDDGSLSIFCGKIKRKYVNVETQHGHSFELKNMLRILDEVLK